jgi:flagellar assembly protein FliH
MVLKKHSFGEAISLFDRDFDDSMMLDDVVVIEEHESMEAPPEAELPLITPVMLEEACAAAHANGLRQGRAEVAAARDSERDAMMRNLLCQLRGAEESLCEMVETAGARLAGLVLASLEASFPNMCVHHGSAEVVRFTRNVVELLGEEPRIVIRVHPTLETPLDALISDLEPERQQAILVELRDTIPPGDVRIAWRHGLATRDVAALHTRVAEVLAQLGFAPGEVRSEGTRLATAEHIATD